MVVEKPTELPLIAEVARKTGIAPRLGIRVRLSSYRNAITRMPEWADYDGLNTQLAAPAADFTLSARYTNKTTRSMGRVALMATRASELALIDAGLQDDPLLKSGRLGIAYGSSAGTPKAICDFHVYQDDGTYRARESRSISRCDGAHYSDFQRLHVGQPRHWLRL